MLEIIYVPYLVVASIGVAIMGSFTSLRLTSGLAALSAQQRKVRITQAAFALGGGIWSMHFVGMLSIKIGIPIFYDPLQTLGSALIAILLTGSALMSLHFGIRTRMRIALAGVITAMGIVSMHYVGMSAISGNCIVSYGTGGVLLAVGIAMVTCILAMELAYRKRSFSATVCGSIVLGLAISAIHYSAMLFTTFSAASSLFVVSNPAISSANLALIVAIATFLTCGWFLLTAVPGGATPPDVRGTDPEPANRLTAQAGTGNRNRNASAYLSKAFDKTLLIHDPTAELSTRIPYERDKTLRFLSADTLAFARADGHYTRIANGDHEFFCPWSISRLEKSLNSADFIRTHRSYLVNKNFITGFRRNGDKALCLVGKGIEKEIPVSRSRVSDVQATLGL